MTVKVTPLSVKDVFGWVRDRRLEDLVDCEPECFEGCYADPGEDQRVRRRRVLPYGNGFYPVKEWSQHKCKGRNLRIWIYSGSGNGKFITDDKHLNLDRKALYQTGNSIIEKQHPIRDIYSSIYELKGSPKGLKCRTSINAIGCVVLIYKGAYCARYTAPLT